MSIERYVWEVCAPMQRHATGEWRVSGYLRRESDAPLHLDPFIIADFDYGFRDYIEALRFFNAMMERNKT